MRRLNLMFTILLVVFAIAVTTNVAYGFKAREQKNPIEAKEFFSNQLYVSQTNLQLSLVMNQLTNSSSWQNFLAKNPTAQVYIDPRSGRPTSIVTPIPLIPGTGEGNNITLTSVSQKLGRKIDAIGSKEVKELAIDFFKEHSDILAIEAKEFAEVRIGNPVNYLWDVYIRRAINGIPVRDAMISASINHGNVVMWGVEKWGDIKIDLIPAISSDKAVQTAFDYIGGSNTQDQYIVRPHLEIIPMNPQNWSGAVGSGYDYNLVWAFTFRRPGFNNTWEFLIDVHNGKILSFVDKNQYASKKITGMVYPVSNDGCGTDGTATNYPMPYTDTGLASPNNYTNLGGVYNYTSGTVTTTLTGRYADIATENCGTVSETSATGDIDLAGANGDHDCTVPGGHSIGDTASSRSAASEVTFINRTARSWVNYTWLDSAVGINVNINNTCNAFWNGTTVNFYRSGGGCGNTGEIAAVFDHEWGHGVDANDTAGASAPGEVYADIIANLRLHTSCTGRGFFTTLDRTCGQWTCPSTGSTNGYNCAGYGDCCTGCTGVRDQDYAKHVSGTAHTPANFICVRCGSGSGPCGKEVHCENAPMGEAGWDLGARDLQASPFNLDKQTAFEVANRVFYIGAGGVTNWYTCNCTNNTSDGCATTAGYMRYLTADADDGNINNGTPHMTAIYAAFNRHAIACDTPSAVNQGCSGGPSAAPTGFTGTPGDNQVVLNWNAVTGASQYYVFRTEGAMGCDFGKVIIATVPATTFTDAQVLNGRTYYYSVQAVASNLACFGPLSTCINVIPQPSGTCTAPTFGGVQSVADVNACTASGIRVNWAVPTSWGTGATSGTYDVRRYTTAGCTGGYTTVATGLAAATTTYVDTSGTAGTTYYYQINAINNCTSPMSSTGTTSCSLAIVDAADTTPCPNVGNTLMVTKSGTNASIAWTTVTCTDIAGYRIYGSTTYSATFPTGWTLINTPVSPPQTDPLASNYVAYKGATVDACGNASSN